MKSWIDFCEEDIYGEGDNILKMEEKEEGNEEEEPRFWERGGEGSSSHIFVSFVVVTILMVIIVLSAGAYGYYSWQDWKKGPQIVVQEGEFEPIGAAGENHTQFTVHTTVKNEGEGSSGDLRLEWFVMRQGMADRNIYLQRGDKDIPSLEKGERGEVSFDLNLSNGGDKRGYILSYRVYEEGRFSHEARQSLEVSQGEAPTGTEPETESVPEYPFIMIPVVSLLAIFLMLRKVYPKKKEGKDEGG